MLKLLEVWIIYLIYDSKWVSLFQVIPKKGGMTIVKSEKVEQVATITAMGWRICINYRKINKASNKNHFPLPLIDQMLERQAKHTHFWYLNGYSGFSKSPYTLVTNRRCHSLFFMVHSPTDEFLLGFAIRMLLFSTP